MNVRNCRRCGRMFNYVMGSFVCPSCREGLEADFQKVKTYVREHPGATITEVSEECEVATSQIHQWLREERLELAEGSAIVLNCEACGGPITCGRYCDQCRRGLTMGLKDASRSLQKQQAPVEKDVAQQRDRDKMRYLNK